MVEVSPAGVVVAGFPSDKPPAIVVPPAPPRTNPPEGVLVAGIDAAGTDAVTPNFSPGAAVFAGGPPPRTKPGVVFAAEPPSVKPVAPAGAAVVDDAAEGNANPAAGVAVVANPVDLLPNSELNSGVPVVVVAPPSPNPLVPESAAIGLKNSHLICF